MPPVWTHVLVQDAPVIVQLFGSGHTCWYWVVVLIVAAVAAVTRLEFADTATDAAITTAVASINEIAFFMLGNLLSSNIK